MSSDKKIDENLYSRQLYVIGHDAMQRMQKSNVLIVGLNGLGVEIAKNVILTGVKSVLLHDTKSVTYMDLSSQFYLSEKDIGKNRLDSCFDQLTELNPYVTVEKYKGELTEDFLVKNEISCVVFADHHTSDLIKMNDICRKRNIKFISAESRGLCGSIFVDVGKNFEIYDTDGENPETSVIVGITNENPGVVSVSEEKRHGLYTGDYVVFEGIEGMEELNNREPMQIVSTGLHTFTICDTSKFGKYKRGGYVKQVKMKKTVSYPSLQEALVNPSIAPYDFGKENIPGELHIAFQTLTEYVKRNKKYPRPYNKQDADEFLKIAKTIHSKPDAMNENLMRKFSYTCQGNLSPIAAFIGGVAAQEVQKAVSGKFTPLNNFLYFEAFECLPDSLPTENETQPKNSRYDGQIVVFGNTFQEKLLKQKTFVVGCGALGCEYLKNFAMMGLGCHKEGKVIVTDMDNIEISNLNRQFLFRKKHVGQSKSKIGAKIASEMNDNLNIISLTEKVAPETEEIFDDEFWESLDFITNALDNVQARLYVDSRCVYYRKPLFESGTLGTKGNVQVVIPNLTESYGSSRDPPEKDIPICTLKNFPNAIEHTIQYARDLFEGIFKQIPEDVNSYLSKPDFLEQLERQGLNKVNTLQNIYEALSSKPNNFDECVVWARLKFEELFSNQIKQLLFNFPEDMKTSSGTPFWGGSKRPPKPIQFSTKDPLHMSFIKAAAILHAQNYGLKVPSENYDYTTVLNNVQVPKFVPKTGVKIATTPEEAKEEEQSGIDDDNVCESILKKLPKPSSLSGYRLNPIEFEKDDDTNYHIEFITAASNLRARNYKIPEADKHKTKLIAGKIIPAMITTTALITGLACLEMYKVIRGANKVEEYRNTFVNIALPFITQSDPVKPPTQKYGETEWTLWDRFDVDLGRELTLKEFLEYFKEKYKLEITMMSSGTAVIYSFFLSKDKLNQRLPMKLSEIVEMITKQKFLPKQRYINFEICVTDEAGEDVDVPFVKYRFRF